MTRRWSIQRRWTMQRGKGFDLVIRKLVGFDQSKIEFGLISIHQRLVVLYLILPINFPYMTILVFGSSLPHGMYTTWR